MQYTSNFSDIEIFRQRSFHNKETDNKQDDRSFEYVGKSSTEFEEKRAIFADQVYQEIQEFMRGIHPKNLEHGHLSLP